MYTAYIVCLEIIINIGYITDWINTSLDSLLNNKY
ncbi:hypothetical protein BROSI_A2505 [Candidatus Brocadia sinica JPN1]|uniref:Uncharacterized protein n=1 Tax=Candidatus Brocadia sinica JPN1 TaxID=1197129 RepID=A0ABQ0JZ33_9BACT|nr:hypothetical protein BROSI_A2505 [Candidatus Brocadia sinica JPN1]